MITINESLCKGCDLCAWVCPKKILRPDKTRVNDKGYSPMVCVDEGQCVACAVCAKFCPDSAISVG
jgi:2-oxoglutarate ferredoxin oxidoreductase subunit delta